ncbi:MAG TPA: hypothetical protein VKT53_10720 [Candidatus Acidoferrum sp.]|nr:hypothetical protein [Candidatus Acidoferrum sp.]
MKTILVVVFAVALSMMTISFGKAGALAVAQAGAEKSEAQASFDKMKALEGNWEGKVTVAEHPDMNNAAIQVSLRVTSMGNALVHEMHGEGRPDHPVTMVYLDGGQLTLTHYCDAGNRPRMTGKLLADGKTVEFGFLDVAGPMTYGHMHHAVFTAVDANHHTEDWTFMEPGDKMAHAHMELTRAK